MDIAYSHVILEWSFTPADFFGEPVVITREGYVQSISHGKAEVRIDGDRFAAGEVTAEQVQRELDGRFRASQLFRRRPFELSGPRTIKIRSDGTRHFFLEVAPAVIKITGGTVGVRITDGAGGVVHDSEAARLKREKGLEDRVAKHAADPLLVRLLKSFDSAVRDPDNELVHLYEVREALATRFGGRQAIQSNLRIVLPEWGRFGQLCNDEPLRQGRHRGKMSGPLRDATAAELDECRELCVQLIDSYLDWLETSILRP